LDTGVGLGSARLSLLVEVDGERIGWEYIDVTTLVEQWAAAIVDDFTSGNTSERDRIAGVLETYKRTKRAVDETEDALDDAESDDAGVVLPEREHTDLMAEHAIEDAEREQ